LHVFFKSVESRDSVQPEEGTNIRDFEGLSLEIGVIDGIGGGANVVAVMRVGLKFASSERVTAELDRGGTYENLS